METELETQYIRTNLKNGTDRRSSRRSFYRHMMPLIISSALIISSLPAAAAETGTGRKAALLVKHYVAATHENHVVGKMITMSLPGSVSRPDKLFRSETVPITEQLVLGQEYAESIVILEGAFDEVWVAAEPIRLVIRPETTIGHLNILEGLSRTMVKVGSGAFISEWTGWNPENKEMDSADEQNVVVLEEMPTENSRPKPRNPGGGGPDVTEPYEPGVPDESGEPNEPGEPDEPNEPNEPGNEPPDEDNGNPGDDGDSQDPVGDDDDNDDDPAIPDPDSPFDGGWGTEESPYRIASMDQLVALIHYDPLNPLTDPYENVGGATPGEPDAQPVTDYLHAHYVMTADINLMYEKVKPIGSSAHPFMGHFDGQGHTIRGLKIDEATDSTVGFFASVGRDAAVENLTIEEPDIQGTRHVGVLAGYNEGFIRSVRITGSIPLVNNGKRPSRVELYTDFSTGGLVGSNQPDGIIQSTYVHLSITNNPNTNNEAFLLPHTGMIAGINQGLVERSAAEGNIIKAYLRQGGLVGYNYGGIIRNSWADVDLAIGITRRGGLVGHDGGMAGGLIENVYAEGKVGEIFPNRIGYLIGSQVPPNSVITGAYYNLYDHASPPDTQIGTPLTPAAMALQESFVEFDFDRIWIMAGEGSERRPRLRCEP